MLIAVVVARTRNQTLTALDRITTLLRTVAHAHIIGTRLTVVTAVALARARRAITTATHITVRAVVAVVAYRAARLTRHTTYRAVTRTVTHLATRVRALTHALRTASAYVVTLIIRTIAIVVRAVATLRRIRMNRAITIVAVALLGRVVLARR